VSRIALVIVSNDRGDGYDAASLLEEAGFDVQSVTPAAAPLYPKTEALLEAVAEASDSNVDGPASC
jgi:hypothetical protein